MSKLEFHRDQVEEVFIQDLNESEIINWLEKNSNNNNFRDLREKYEPIWLKQSKKLKYAVAKYGYNLSVLRDIYFSEDDEVLKGLVLINPNFGGVLHSRHGIGSEEIIRLYKKRRPFFGLFERIFKNYAIDPGFISDLYSGEFYPEIKQGDLALILDYLSHYTTDEKGKTPIENWVNNFDRYAIGLESNRALEKIVSFIANYKFKNKYSYQEIEVFYRALERIGNIEVSVFAVSEIETIRKFDPSRFSKATLSPDGEEMLISISAWFEKRILSRNVLSPKGI